MTKKLQNYSILLLFAVALYVIPVYASDSDYVTVNVFHEIYFGTLSQNPDSVETTFTSLPSYDNPFSITGQWANEMFTKNCTITYDNGTVQSVTYKKGLISGNVISANPDGTYQTFSCTSGKPYGKISTFSANDELIDLDWFYQCTPMETWINQALSPDYADLLSSPYDYMDFSIKVTGTVENIYETSKQSFYKVLDENNNLYIFVYQNPDTHKYAHPNVENVSVGDSVIFVGLFLQLYDGEKAPLSFYEHLSGNQVSYSQIQPYIENNDFVSAVQNISQISDEDLEVTFPEFDIICCFKEETAADPLDLQYTYDEICNYPFYYKDMDIALEGKVIYESTNISDDIRELLVQKENTSDIYVVSFEPETTVDTVFLNQTISCDGTMSENSKLAYYNPESHSVGYALYPNITTSEINVLSQ